MSGMLVRVAASVCVAASVVGAIGCRAQSSASVQSRIDADPKLAPAAAGSKSVNQTCAASGKGVDQSHNLMYDGETIGFCSAGTRERFVMADDAERQSWVAAAKKGERVGG